MNYSGETIFRDGKQIETHESYHNKIKSLGEQMQTDILGGKIDPFTKILLIPRGGLSMVDVLCRMFNLGSERVVSYARTSYEEEGTDLREEVLSGQAPTAADIKGEHMLIADEICESGGTLVAAKKLLRELGAASVVTAVVHSKPTKTATGFLPDYVFEEVDIWVEYPSESFDRLGLEYTESLKQLPKKLAD